MDNCKNNAFGCLSRISKAFSVFRCLFIVYLSALHKPKYPPSQTWPTNSLDRIVFHPTSSKYWSLLYRFLVVGTQVSTSLAQYLARFYCIWYMWMIFFYFLFWIKLQLVLCAWQTARRRAIGSPNNNFGSSQCKSKLREYNFDKWS